MWYAIAAAEVFHEWRVRLSHFNQEADSRGENLNKLNKQHEIVINSAKLAIKKIRQGPLWPRADADLLRLGATLGPLQDPVYHYRLPISAVDSEAINNSNVWCF